MKSVLKKRYDYFKVPAADVHGHPQVVIILTLSPCTMKILKWPVTTFFNCLNLNFVFKF